MVINNEVAEIADMSKWSEVFANLYNRIAHRFRRSEVRERARRYVMGLLGKVERKNGWQLAEELGENDSQGVQRLLNAACWDADAVRDDLREYVVAHLGEEESGILIVDETGLLTKGRKSCGVARQYTGTAGATVNAHTQRVPGVFLAYATRRGVAFIDRALYLPQEWMADEARCAEAGIPPQIPFTTKIVLAQHLLGRAFAAGVPARWVVADSFYGRSHAFRHWIEEHHRAYVVMIPKTNAIQYRGERELAEQVSARLSEAMWMPLSSGAGSQGERIHDWACLDLSEPYPAGMERWLLVRRDPEGSHEHTYWMACGPQGTEPAELVQIADARWQVEECFAQAKGEIGLDHYEVRTWTAWHRFVTLALLAHAFLVVLRAHARSAPPSANPEDRPRELIPLTVDFAVDQGIGVIDPHGDLIDDLCAYLAVVGQSRGEEFLRERVVLIDLTNPHSSVAFNPVEQLPGVPAGEQAAELISSFRKIWADSWGVRPHARKYVTD